MSAAIIRAARRTFRSLQIRNYRLYFFGQIVSMTGTWMQIVGQMWLVFQLTGSGVALGVTTALQFVPMLVAGPWGGIVADRFNKRRVLIVTQAASAFFAVVLAALTLTGIVELWMVYALALMLGFVTVIDVPTRQSFYIEMVGPEDLSNAVGLNSTVFTSARVIGPAIAGLLISTVGIGWAFLLNALSFLALISSLTRMDESKLHRAEPVARAKGQLREGLRYVWSTPVLRSSLLLVAVIGTLAFNFRVLLPLMADRVFNGGAGTYGVLSAVQGAGTVLGALLAAGRSRPSRRVLVGSALLFGILMLLAAAAPSLALELLVLFPLGAASLVFIVTANATLQLNSTDAMRGRVMALYTTVFLGTTPIGSPFIGWVAEHFGARAAFVVAGGATVAAALAALWMLGRSRMAARRPVRRPAVALTGQDLHNPAREVAQVGGVDRVRHG